ncbi:hypothetical protein ATANTOWER_010002, partial [Ataeniobius toweri]|nr:hypothetical protein [Ataeniobius toweri]
LVHVFFAGSSRSQPSGFVRSLLRSCSVKSKQPEHSENICPTQIQRTTTEQIIFCQTPSPVRTVTLQTLVVCRTTICHHTATVCP